MAGYPWRKTVFFVSLLGHFSFSVFAVYLLVIFPLSFIVKNHRTFRGLMVILSTICITLLLFDTEVFHRFNLHLSSVVWNLLVNPDNGEMSRDWQIFFAPMPIILLVQMLFSRWSWEKLRSLERQKWLKAVGIFSLRLLSRLISFMLGRMRTCTAQLRCNALISHFLIQ
ncbi:sulfatase family protein [Rodentibacter pneumotropicus]|uniref:Sulfatase family protein n=1 Tax=Rodentibacter pneumotropicus TaxID=758 RepID=A0A448MKP9_9PAST|nr:sulfatase family protein [Rodentibacter pneumotropicus]